MHSHPVLKVCVTEKKYLRIVETVNCFVAFVNLTVFYCSKWLTVLLLSCLIHISYVIEKEA